jgi:Spy/CpxP family protein refolding chaperone
MSFSSAFFGGLIESRGVSIKRLGCLKKERTMKDTIGIFFTAFCALAIVSSAAFAQDCPMGMGKAGMMYGHKQESSQEESGGMFFHQARFILMQKDEIGLTEEQVEKVKTLQYNVEKNLIKEKADLELLVLDIREELRKDDINLNAVRGLIDKKYAAKAQKAKEDVEAYVNLKNILSKDQQKKLQEMGKGGMKGKMEHGEKGMWRGKMMESKEGHATQGRGEHGEKE